MYSIVEPLLGMCRRCKDCIYSLYSLLVLLSTYPNIVENKVCKKEQYNKDHRLSNTLPFDLVLLHGDLLPV